MAEQKNSPMQGR